MDRRRVSRLRRIVRDGNEVRRLLERLCKDLHAEIPVAFQHIERGADRAADLLSDIDDACSRVGFFAEGQARQASERLEREKVPIVAPRVPRRPSVSKPVEDRPTTLLELFGGQAIKEEDNELRGGEGVAP